MNRMPDERLTQLLQLLDNASWREVNELPTELLQALEAERECVVELQRRLDAVKQMCNGASCDIGLYIHRDRILAALDRKMQRMTDERLADDRIEELEADLRLSIRTSDELARRIAKLEAAMEE